MRTRVTIIKLKELKVDNDGLKAEVKQLKTINLQLKGKNEVKFDIARNKMREIYSDAEKANNNLKKKQDEVMVQLKNKDSEIYNLKKKLHEAEREIQNVKNY